MQTITLFPVLLSIAWIGGRGQDPGHLKAARSIVYTHQEVRP